MCRPICLLVGIQVGALCCLKEGAIDEKYSDRRRAIGRVRRPPVLLERRSAEHDAVGKAGVRDAAARFERSDAVRGGVQAAGLCRAEEDGARRRLHADQVVDASYGRKETTQQQQRKQPGARRRTITQKNDSL